MITYYVFLESAGQNLCNGGTVFKHSSVPTLFVCLIKFVCLFDRDKNKNLILLLHIIYFWNHQEKTYTMKVLCLNILQF